MTAKEIQLPLAAQREVKLLREAGAPIWLELAIEGGPDACQNCRGSGVLLVRIADATEAAPSPSGLLGAAYVDGVGWYPTHMRSYICPVCRPDAVDPRLAKSSGLLPHELAWKVGYIRGLAGKDAAYLATVDLLKRIPEVSGWLSIVGDHGVGKTGLLKASVATAIRAGIPARYVRAGDMLSEATATFTQEDGQPDHNLRDAHELAVKRRYAGYALLAVDEIDRIGRGQWSLAWLFSVLDERYARRHQAATILATNTGLGSFPQALAYLSSRMTDGVQATMAGDVLRGGAQ